MTQHHKLSDIFILATFLLLFWATSCQKSEFVSFDDLPVVEAYLIPGEKILVKISQKMPYEDNTPDYMPDVNTLDIFVIYATRAYQLTLRRDGVYVDSSGAIPVMTDSTYLLHLVYNGNPVTSSTIIPSKPQSVTQSATSITMEQFDPDDPPGPSMPDPVEIMFSNADDSYYFVTVECMDSVLVPVIKDSIPSNDIFSSQPVTGTEIDIQPMMIRYFGKNRIILYHINPEYLVFFQQQANTSQNYQEPPTNVVNGLGVFTGINADTLYLEVIQQ